MVEETSEGVSSHLSHSPRGLAAAVGWAGDLSFVGALFPPTGWGTAFDPASPATAASDLSGDGISDIFPYLYLYTDRSKTTEGAGAMAQPLSNFLTGNYWALPRRARRGIDFCGKSGNLET